MNIGPRQAARLLIGVGVMAGAALALGGVIPLWPVLVAGIIAEVAVTSFQLGQMYGARGT